MDRKPTVHNIGRKGPVRSGPDMSGSGGQTLVETIVALSVLVMGLMGLIALLSRSFAISNFVSENYIATYLASEGVEVVKSMIDHNFALGTSTPWNDGLVGNCPCEVEWNSTNLSFPPTGQNLLLDAATGLYSYQPGGAQTKFIRTIDVVLDGGDPNHLKVNSVVKWRSSGGITGLPILSEVNLENHFFNLRN